MPPSCIFLDPPCRAASSGGGSGGRSSRLPALEAPGAGLFPAGMFPSRPGGRAPRGHPAPAMPSPPQRRRRRPTQTKVVAAPPRPLCRLTAAPPGRGEGAAAAMAPPPPAPRLFSPQRPELRSSLPEKLSLYWHSRPFLLPSRGREAKPRPFARPSPPTAQPSPAANIPSLGFSRNKTIVSCQQTAPASLRDPDPLR